jgi:hypothetical protein
MPTCAKCQLLTLDASHKLLWKRQRSFGSPCQLNNNHLPKRVCYRLLVTFLLVHWSTQCHRLTDFIFEWVAGWCGSSGKFICSKYGDNWGCQWKHAVYDTNQNIQDASDKKKKKKSWQLFSREDSKRGPHEHKAGILTSTTEYSSRVNEFSKNPRNPQNSKRRNGDAK